MGPNGPVITFHYYKRMLELEMQSPKPPNPQEAKSKTIYLNPKPQTLHGSFIGALWGSTPRYPTGLAAKADVKLGGRAGDVKASGVYGLRFRVGV